MPKIPLKKLVRALLPLIALALFVVPHLAHAWLFDSAAQAVADVAYTIIAKIVFGFSYIISALLGIFIMVETWMVSVVLFLNQGIVNSPVVQAGFPVTLAIANLGFVLGIIVIAIGTILRLQQYGIKQMLWKLIIMAILVNFGLVIAGGILNFADSVTLYFVNNITPGSNPADSLNNFASTLAGAFNPQSGLVGVNKEVAGSDSKSDIEAAGATIGTNVGTFLAPISSLLFIIVALFAIILTLGAFFVMLLIRYVYLALLLVLLPLAWLAYVFPDYRRHYSDWWNKFTSQAFFAPAAMFFLWLGMQVANALKSQTMNFTGFIKPSNSMWGALSGFAGNLLTGSIMPLLNATVVVGIMLGGLFAAQKMGGVSASVVTSTAKKIGRGMAKGGRDWARQRGARAATREAPKQYEMGNSRMLNRIKTVTNAVNRGIHKAQAPLRTAVQKTRYSEELKEYGGQDWYGKGGVNETRKNWSKERAEKLGWLAQARKAQAGGMMNHPKTGKLMLKDDINEFIKTTSADVIARNKAVYEDLTQKSPGLFRSVIGQPTGIMKKRQKKLSKEAQEKIAELLEGTEEAKKKASATSTTAPTPPTPGGTGGTTTI